MGTSFRWVLSSNYSWLRLTVDANKTGQVQFLGTEVCWELHSRNFETKTFFEKNDHITGKKLE